jgi:uncharacterized protein
MKTRERKVELIRPRGKVILDTCGGLGYFAAWCLQGQAAGAVLREESRRDLAAQSQSVVPGTGPGLTLTQGDIAETLRAARPVRSMPSCTIRRASASPESCTPRPSTITWPGAQAPGRLFHYTGAPNKLTSGRDVPNEVARRLRLAGFDAELNGDGWHD